MQAFKSWQKIFDNNCQTEWKRGESLNTHGLFKMLFFRINRHRLRIEWGKKLNQNNEKSLFHVESICFSSSSQLNYSLQNYTSSKETKWKLAFTLPTDVPLNWIRFSSFMCYQALSLLIRFETFSPKTAKLGEPRNYLPKRKSIFCMFPALLLERYDEHNST